MSQAYRRVSSGRERSLNPRFVILSLLFLSVVFPLSAHAELAVEAPPRVIPHETIDLRVSFEAPRALAGAVVRVIDGHVLMSAKTATTVVSPVLWIDHAPEHVEADAPVDYTVTVTATAQTRASLTARLRNSAVAVLLESPVHAGGNEASDGTMMIDGSLPGVPCNVVPVCRLTLEMEATGIERVTRPLTVRGRTHVTHPNVEIRIPRVIEDGPLIYEVYSKALPS